MLKAYTQYKLASMKRYLGSKSNKDTKSVNLYFESRSLSNLFGPRLSAIFLVHWHYNLFWVSSCHSGIIFPLISSFAHRQIEIPLLVSAGIIVHHETTICFGTALYIHSWHFLTHFSLSQSKVHRQGCECSWIFFHSNRILEFSTDRSRDSVSTRTWVLFRYFNDLRKLGAHRVAKIRTFSDCQIIDVFYMLLYGKGV